RVLGVKPLQGGEQGALKGQPLRRRHHEDGVDGWQFDRFALFDDGGGILGGERAIAREDREVNKKRRAFEQRCECCFRVCEGMWGKLAKSFTRTALAGRAPQIKESSTANRALGSGIAQNEAIAGCGGKRAVEHELDQPIAAGWYRRVAKQDNACAHLRRSMV